MSFFEFLEYLKSQQITLSFSGGEILLSGAEEKITSELRAAIEKYHGNILQYFWPAECRNLIPLQPEGHNLPFFLIHGSKKANYVLAGELGNEQPVYGFLHYGISGEKIGVSSVKEYAQDYIRQMKSVLPSGPFLLGGFSFGGTLAFEIAVQLQKEGYQVPLLMLVDCICPLAKEHWWFNLVRYVYRVIFYPGRYGFVRRIKLYYCSRLHRKNKPLPMSMRYFYIVNKYFSLLKGYQPEHFNGKLLLFRATKNKSTYPKLGWENLADEVELIPIEGNHLELLSDSKLLKTMVNRIRAAASMSS
jgi:thioesterase domain-containing protein